MSLKQDDTNYWYDPLGDLVRVIFEVTINSTTPCRIVLRSLVAAVNRRADNKTAWWIHPSDHFLDCETCTRAGSQLSGVSTKTHRTLEDVEVLLDQLSNMS